MVSSRHLFAVAVCSLIGCGSARLVHRTPTGGTIALHGDPNEAMKHARQMMLEHCRGPYQIIEEGETVVGQTTTTQDETFVTEDGTAVTTSDTSTANTTEWRIRYLCGAGASRGAAQPAPPADGDGYPAPPPPEQSEQTAPPSDAPPSPEYDQP